MFGISNFRGKVQTGALDLLSHRLPDISDKIRHDITPTVNQIIESIRKVVVAQSEGPLVVSAFRAMASIGSTMCPGEENSMTNSIPLLIAAIRGRTLAASAMAALAPLPFVEFYRFCARLIDALTETNSDLGLSHTFVTLLAKLWQSCGKTWRVC